MDRVKGTKENKVWTQKGIGPKQEEIGAETGTSWGSLEIPAILVLWGRGCLRVVGLSTKSVASVSVSTGRECFSKLIKRGD